MICTKVKSKWGGTRCQVYWKLRTTRHLQLWGWVSWSFCHNWDLSTGRYRTFFWCCSLYYAGSRWSESLRETSRDKQVRSKVRPVHRCSIEEWRELSGSLNRIRKHFFICSHDQYLRVGVFLQEDHNSDNIPCYDLQIEGCATTSSTCTYRRIALIYWWLVASWCRAFLAYLFKPDWSGLLGGCRCQ